MQVDFSTPTLGLFCSACGYGKIHIHTVGPAAVVRTDWESIGGCAAVLPDEAPQAAQPLSTAECPECLLPEEQIDARVGRARVDQRGQDRRLNFAQLWRGCPQALRIVSIPGTLFALSIASASTLGVTCL